MIEARSFKGHFGWAGQDGCFVGTSTVNVLLAFIDVFRPMCCLAMLL